MYMHATGADEYDSTANMKTRRRMRRDLEENFVYIDEDSMEEDQQQAEPCAAKNDKYDTLDSPANKRVARMKVLDKKKPAQSELENHSQGLKTTERKRDADSGLLNVIMNPSSYKKYLSRSPDSGHSESASNCNSFKIGSSSGSNSNFDAIIGKVNEIKSRSHKVGRCMDAIKLKLQLAPLADRKTNLTLDFSKVHLLSHDLNSVREQEKVLVERLVGRSKEVLVLDGKVLGSIKRSCVHSFRINDAHGFSVLVVQKKTFLAEGHGLVSNSFGKPLYRGRVENGKLQGQGVLFNTLLQPSPDSK